MSETANIELAQGLISAYVGADDSVLETLVSASYRDHGRRPVAVGPAGVRESLRCLHSTFEEVVIDVEDLIVAQDRVVARVRLTATHVGELEGIPATGRRVETEHVHIWRVAGQRLAEHWVVRDDLGTLLQLGARIAPAGS